MVIRGAFGYPNAARCSRDELPGIRSRRRVDGDTSEEKTRKRLIAGNREWSGPVGPALHVPGDALRKEPGGVGCHDFLLSPSVIRRVIDRMAQQPTPELAALAKLHELTPPEREVLDLVAWGLSNCESPHRSS